MSRILTALVCTLLSSTVLAQAYPAKTVRMVIPVAAGSSSNDILGRALAQKLSDAMGQQFIVENQPGASGNIGSLQVARAAPDGYTLLLGYSSAQTISPNVFKSIGYDPVRDLAAIAQFCVVPYVLVAHPGLPASNIKELIALAKSRPGKINFASSGIGSTPHLAAELFKLETGINIVHVPYKGGALAANDLIAGHVQMYFSGITSVAPFVKTGKLRAIAVTTAARSALLPDTPTASESGLPGFETSSWLGVLAPARTPEPIVERLYGEIAKITNSTEMKNFLLTQGAEPALMTPAKFGESIRVELAKWGKVVKSANITPE